MSEITKAIQVMAGTSGLDNVTIAECEVVSVNEDERTCECITISGKSSVELTEVRLIPVVADGILIVPKVGSVIIVHYSKDILPFVSQFSEVEKILLITGDTTIEIKDGSVKFNDGSFDGFVKIKDLTSKLNDMIKFINIELGKIQTGIVTGGGSYTPTNLQQFNKSDYENTKITHGA